jgi:hypothetical protein
LPPEPVVAADEEPIEWGSYTKTVVQSDANFASDAEKTTLFHFDRAHATIANPQYVHLVEGLVAIEYHARLVQFDKD